MDELIKYKKLTQRQKIILQMLADGEDLVFEKGGGWWIGLEQTNGKMFFTLIRSCCISQDSTDKGMEHWSINETGIKALSEGWLFRINSPAKRKNDYFFLHVKVTNS